MPTSNHPEPLCTSGVGPHVLGPMYMLTCWSYVREGVSCSDLIDAHSKWFEVCQMLNTTSTATTQHLKTIFLILDCQKHLSLTFSSEEFAINMVSTIP